MLFDVDTWPNYLRWMLFLPISLLAFFFLAIYNLIIDGSSFFTILFIGAIGRPIAFYIGLRIAPKAKKRAGYFYLVLYTIDVISNIADYFITFNGITSAEPTWFNIGNTLGILVGTLVTYYLFLVSDFEKDFKRI